MREVKGDGGDGWWRDWDKNRTCPIEGFNVGQVAVCGSRLGGIDPHWLKDSDCTAGCDGWVGWKGFSKR